MTNLIEEPMNSVERVLTTLQLKEPDRVPVWPLMDYLPINYYDISAKEIVFNPAKSQKAYEWIYNKLGGYDIAMAGGIMNMLYLNPFPDCYSSYYFDWKLPGRTCADNIPAQLVHQSNLLTEKGYDRLIDEGFIWLMNFKNAGLKDMMSLPIIAKKVAKNIKKWWNHYKVPTFSDGGVTAPYDLLSFFRGLTNFSRDIYKRPEKIMEASDLMVDGLIAMAEFGAAFTKGKTILVGSARASADFISDKHFEKLYWPYLKRLVEGILKDGFIVQLHFDTNWTERLHYFLELPKGMIYLHLDESTDICKAKEILGDHMCIQGNLKPSLFTFGTPYMIEKQTKEIIENCAEGGGLIVGSELPDDAKLENVKAMIDTCKKYGVYK